MANTRKMPTADEIIEKARRGVIDESELYLSLEELAASAAPEGPRHAVQAETSADDDGRAPRARDSVA